MTGPVALCPRQPGCPSEETARLASEWGGGGLLIASRSEHLGPTREATDDDSFVDGLGTQGLCFLYLLAFDLPADSWG
jgi:hypothetical protein